MMNPSQKLRSPKAGAPSKAADLGHTIAALKRMIVAGKGIVVGVLGDQVVISAKAGLIPRGGGGDGGWIERPSREELPDASTVPETTLARITEGDEMGFTLMVNPAKDNWIAWNFWD